MNMPQTPDPARRLPRWKLMLRMFTRVVIALAVVAIVYEALTGFTETWPVWVAMTLVLVGLALVVVSVAASGLTAGRRRPGEAEPRDTRRSADGPSRTPPPALPESSPDMPGTVTPAGRRRARAAR